MVVTGPPGGGKTLAVGAALGAWLRDQTKSVTILVVGANDPCTAELARIVATIPVATTGKDVHVDMFEQTFLSAGGITTLNKTGRCVVGEGINILAAPLKGAASSVELAAHPCVNGRVIDMVVFDGCENIDATVGFAVCGRYPHGRRLFCGSTVPTSVILEPTSPMMSRQYTLMNYLLDCRGGEVDFVVPEHPQRRGLAIQPFIKAFDGEFGSWTTADVRVPIIVVDTEAWMPHEIAKDCLFLFVSVSANKMWAEKAHICLRFRKKKLPSSHGGLSVVFAVSKKVCLL